MSKTIGKIVTEYFALSICQAVIFAWHLTLTVFTKALPLVKTVNLNVWQDFECASGLWPEKIPYSCVLYAVIGSTVKTI